MIKSFRVRLFAVVKAVDTASRARKKVKTQEHCGYRQKALLVIIVNIGLVF